MNSDGTIRAFADMQKAACDDIAGRAAVHEEQVIVVKASICEALGIIDLLVEADDGGDVVLTEVWEVSLRGVERIACIKQKDLKNRFTKREEMYCTKPVKDCEENDWVEICQFFLAFSTLL